MASTPAFMPTSIPRLPPRSMATKATSVQCQEWRQRVIVNMATLQAASMKPYVQKSDSSEASGPKRWSVQMPRSIPQEPTVHMLKHMSSQCGMPVQCLQTRAKPRSQRGKAKEQPRCCRHIQVKKQGQEQTLERAAAGMGKRDGVRPAESDRRG